MTCMLITFYCFSHFHDERNSCDRQWRWFLLVPYDSFYSFMDSSLTQKILVPTEWFFFSLFFLCWYILLECLNNCGIQIVILFFFIGDTLANALLIMLHVVTGLRNKLFIKRELFDRYYFYRKWNKKLNCSE